MRADVTPLMAVLALLALATLAPLVAARSNSPPFVSADRQTAPRTGIAVSAHVTAPPRRSYVVWWDGVSLRGAERCWLTLWDRDPRSGHATPLARMDLGAADAPQGWWDTGIPAEDSHTLPPSFEATQLGRWAGLVPFGAEDEARAAVGVSSLQTRPRWMQQLRAVLAPMSLAELFLPGTHHSATYELVVAGNTTHDKYWVAQEESVLWQLVFGVRYLDLHVSCYPLTEELWWVNHDMLRSRPLVDVLEQVLTFIRATNEIVVLDFHDFPVGFRLQGRRMGNVHDELVRELRELLGDEAAPTRAPLGGWQAPLGQLWAGGRRLVVSYNDAASVAANADFLWSPVSQKGGNVRTLDDLHQYLHGLYISPQTAPWAAMAALTPDIPDFLVDQQGGLRKMADLVNRNVTAWYRGKWGETANIVAVDFFRGTNIVEAAIEWNVHRAQAREVEANAPRRRIPPRKPDRNPQRRCATC